MSSVFHRVTIGEVISSLVQDLRSRKKNSFTDTPTPCIDEHMCMKPITLLTSQLILVQFDKIKTENFIFVLQNLKL